MSSPAKRQVTFIKLRLDHDRHPLLARWIGNNRYAWQTMLRDALEAVLVQGGEEALEAHLRALRAGFSRIPMPAPPAQALAPPAGTLPAPASEDQAAPSRRAVEAGGAPSDADTKGTSAPPSGGEAKAPDALPAPLEAGEGAASASTAHEETSAPAPVATNEGGSSPQSGDDAAVNRLVAIGSEALAERQRRNRAALLQNETLLGGD